MNNLRQKALAAALVIVGTLSGYGFGQRSTTNILEVQEPLQLVTECAIHVTPIDFTVVDGSRTEAEHKANVAKGVSWTKRSRHQDGAAIDFAALAKGRISFDPQLYPPIAEAFRKCSDELGIPIVWGGTWKKRDLMHIELDRRFYP